METLVGSDTLMRVTISVTYAAILMRPRRSLSNCVLRQNDVLGAKPRKVCISQ